MKVLELNSNDAFAFNELALSYGTVFNTLKWSGLFGENVSQYGIYTENHELIGGFNLYKENRFGSSIYIDAPYTPSVGPFFKLNTQNPVSVLSARKEVLAAMADYLREMQYSLLSISLNKNIVDTQNFIWKKFKVSPRYTYVIDLNQSLEVLSKNLHKKRRHCVRKAFEEGLVVKKVTDMNVVRELVAKTLLRQKARFNHTYLDKILFEFAGPGNSFAFVTYRNNTPIATTFFVHDRFTTYALLGGYDNENKHYAANTVSDWEGMKHAKSLGLRYFDFEGSMIPSIERYIRGFGGQLMPYYRISRAKLPLEILLKFFKRELF